MTRVLVLVDGFNFFSAATKTTRWDVAFDLSYPHFAMQLAEQAMQRSLIEPEDRVDVMVFLGVPELPPDTPASEHYLVVNGLWEERALENALRIHRKIKNQERVRDRGLARLKVPPLPKTLGNWKNLTLRDGTKAEAAIISEKGADTMLAMWAGVRAAIGPHDVIIVCSQDSDQRPVFSALQNVAREAGRSVQVFNAYPVELDGSAPKPPLTHWQALKISPEDIYGCSFRPRRRGGARHQPRPA